MTCLPPYYHPTTVCFIDDNYGFLHSLALDLPEDWCFISYLSPEEALAAVNEPNPLPPLVERCMNVEGSLVEGGAIRMDLAVLEREMQLVERFARISVLMIDYAMPTLDGLEFAAAIKDRHMKKILLTGVADEKTAVAAFNEGLIDRYVPKARLAKLSGVIPYVKEMQHAYFEQYRSQLVGALALNPPAFLEEPALSAPFEAILSTHDIVEYYLATEPCGYLLLQRDGTLFRMLILDEAERQAQLATMQRCGAPAGLIDAVRGGRNLCYLFEHPEHYAAHEPFPWEEFVYPVQRVDGRQTWYLSIVPDAPADIDFDPRESCFDRYLGRREPIV